jgi:hypothetical protein
MNAINSIKYVSQRDLKWSTIKLGTSDVTVGRMGCLVTCLSMLSDYFGCYQTPGEIAMNPSNFDGSANVSWVGLNFPKFSFRWREGSMFSDSKKLDMEMIKSYMAKDGGGNPDRAVVLEVANHSHWVVALWPTFDNDILVIDPWTGKTCDVLKEYKNITGAALFVRWSNKTKKAWQNPNQPTAPNYD